MLRYTHACLLFAACFSLSAAAPVPKQSPPRAITTDMMVGAWEYDWGQWPGGVISFDCSGGYTAVHVPGSDQVFFGTWSVKDDAVVLNEYRHDLSTSAVTGPTEYTFQFAAKDYPKLKGKSNGTCDVALSRPKP